jgi:hypothetical protein
MRSNQARKIDIVIEKLVPTIRAVLAEHFVETPTRRPVFRELPGDAERAAEVDEVTRARVRALLKKGGKR